jgi:apolipoprotein N-acyltransferase
MAKIPFEILSLGILVILTALGLAMWAGGLISLAEVPSLVIALFGIWIMALAGIQGNKPAGHGRGAFSTFSWGVLISAVGTVWLLSSRQILVGYLPSFFLLIVGVLIVVAAILYWKK